MQRLVSGIQPTGQLHLGNYIGAINNWIKLQKNYESYFFLADSHAITISQEPEVLRKSIRETAASYIACGLDLNNSAIFAQSSVSNHAELAWILNCFTSMGWMNKMTQFKDKAGKNRDSASVGLYTYPILMAADILIYKADAVPVGDDQRQHLEITRDIAGSFNRHVGQDYFKLPEAIIQKSSARIMSLRDGIKKMSKSDESDFSRINLSDDADLINNKIKKAKTDAMAGFSYDPIVRPEISNLIDIYSALSDLTTEKITDEFASSNMSNFKQNLSNLIISKLEPIRIELNRINNDHAYIDSILKSGMMKARDVTDKHIKEIKELVGFINL